MLQDSRIMNSLKSDYSKIYECIIGIFVWLGPGHGKKCDYFSGGKMCIILSLATKNLKFSTFQILMIFLFLLTILQKKKQYSVKIIKKIGIHGCLGIGLHFRVFSSSIENDMKFV